MGKLFGFVPFGIKKFMLLNGFEAAAAAAAAAIPKSVNLNGLKNSESMPDAAARLAANAAAVALSFVADDADGNDDGSGGICGIERPDREPFLDLASKEFDKKFVA